MSLFDQIKSKKELNKVDSSEVKDRSSANVALAGKDVLDDEAERWKYFFESGCGAWFEDIKEVTFTSTFCDLSPEEAQIIVTHWEERTRMIANSASVGGASQEDLHRVLENHLAEAVEKLKPLQDRLQEAISEETKLSPVGMAFVKLSTRSPKDSKKALARAKAEYRERIDALGGDAQVEPNTRWRILCEETTKSGAVSDAACALGLLLDSDRVFEDLEYALRGPPDTVGDAHTNKWNMQLVARAWDPRLKPESEFRGICWNNKLTCLNQYYHPLLFPELMDKRDEILKDIQYVFESPGVKNAVSRLGGHCIIDFAWLGSGEVIVVELNPFDGVCLGTFPASTGMFLWDDPSDRRIMAGEDDFEFRLREVELNPITLKMQCNSEWRKIIYNEE
jgi:hypothetical protein